MKKLAPARVPIRSWDIACAIAIAGLTMISPQGAAQQHWSVQTGVSVKGEASNNVNFAPAGQEQSDFTLTVSPTISLIGQGGGRVRASGSFDLGATFVTRAQGPNEGRLNARPQGSLNALFEPIDNFFFIDTGLSVQRSVDNPFLARPGGASTYNTSSTYQAHLSPYIQGNLGGDFGYTVRSDNSWTDSSTVSGQYSGRHSALIQRAPQPLGGSLSVEHSQVASQISDEPDRTSDLARAIVRYAVGPELVLGVRGGWERNNYELNNQGKTFHGADLTWRPTERTVLDGYWEDRFFGSSWQASFSHRMPRLALSARTSRDVVTTSQQFLTFPALANLYALLDASLTTRVPDPVERQKIIIAFLSSQQLPPELLTPVVLFDDRVSVQTTSSVSAVLLGIRNSLALSIYRTKTIGIAGVNTQLPSTLADNLQHGADVTFSHNLTPSDTLSATGTWTRTESLVTTGKSETTQKKLNLQVSTKLGAWTNGFFGGRYQWIDSNITNDAREAAVFAGFDYRFF
jgi:uncharacterized protein (PEP-CTERM system associated)